MKVYIAACGIGLGHVTRCEPVARALQEEGNEVAFSTYLDGLDYIKHSFPTFKAVPITYKVQPDGTVDFKMTVARSGFSLGIRRFLLQLRQEIINMRRYRPAVVLSDTRASSLIAAKILGIPVVLLTNQLRVNIVRRPSKGNRGLIDRIFFIIANLGWIFIRTILIGIWALSDFIVIPDLPAPNTISAANISIPKKYWKKTRLIGPILPVKSQSLPEQQELKASLGLDGHRPLIYAAASGPRIEREALSRKLLDILVKLPERYQIVISLGDPNGTARPVRLGNVIVYKWIEDQYKFLKACDVLIGRAGHGTILKALVFEKPMILIPIPDQTEQIANAQRAAKLGAAVIIQQDQLCEESLLNAIQSSLAVDVPRIRAPRRLNYDGDAITELLCLLNKCSGMSKQA